MDSVQLPRTSRKIIEFTRKSHAASSDPNCSYLKDPLDRLMNNSYGFLLLRLARLLDGSKGLFVLIRNSL